MDEFGFISRGLKSVLSESPILVMIQGLPASGKTTLARTLVEEGNCKRVSKDDLRDMIDLGEYSKDNEVVIRGIRDAIVIWLLSRRYNVVVDDTNLNPVHEESLSEIAEASGARFLPYLVGTSLDECIRRDATREKPVGESVIRGMAEKYLSGG